MSNIGVNRFVRISLLAAALLLRVVDVAGAAEARKEQPALSREGIEFFEKKIRPLLTGKCYKCHSAGAEKIKGGLLLDSRSGWMKGGESGPVIVPGDPEKSRLIHAVRYTDSSLQMPPKEILPAAQIVDLEAWVRMGAPDPRADAEPSRIAHQAPRTNHWAFLQPRDFPPPKIKDKKWPRSPIDHFILAGLEKRKLKPGAPADKRTLIRRATFDLTGLPPKPEEIEAFLADNSTNAFANVVDRLLATPQYGERWGRHWLDVARYADSNGLEINLPYENAWRYRDYVVRAFNEDKPFDQFIREQIAGDLLPGDSEEQRYEQLIATGFLMLGPKLLFERKAKLDMDIVDEQIDVTTRAFLGLTVSCARCHDHKFDPIPTRDYYALAGIFASTATLASDAQPMRGPPRWRERPLATPEKAKAVEDHAAAVTKLEASLQAAREMKKALPGGVSSSDLGGIVVDNMAAQLTGAWKESLYSTNFIDKNYVQDGNTGKGKKSARFVPDLPEAGRYEVQFAYVWRHNRAKNVPVTVHSANETRTVLVDQTEPPTIDDAFASLGVFEFVAGTNGAVVISNEGTEGFVTIDAVRFVPASMDVAMKPQAGPMAKAKKSGTAMMDRTGYQLLDDLSDLRAKAPPPVPMAMAAQDGAIRNGRINLRGDPEKLGSEVPRGFLSVLEKAMAPPPSLPIQASGRLELADWIASHKNPLTARVAVNRVWHHLFGGRLVESVDNFGALGETPTHAELLDYLALRFMERGGSFKKTIRSLMLSSTYQMSSELDPVAYARDPENKWMWRMNRRRLDAEAIRDAVLAVSGQLDLEMGGSLSPTNNDAPPGAVPVAGNAQVVSTRRSLYLPVIRNDTPDMFQVFDFADPHVITGKRHTTTAPTQALFMMNSPFMLAQSRKWAESLLATRPADDGQCVASAYMQALGRPAAAEEAERALRFLANYQFALENKEPDMEKRRLMTWQSFCHALLASTELRFID